ncbi:MAG TPA: PLD nuclease N-terminal domain-containing protein [Pseudogracilibacillus sp.]|nr:PLD nuclease N-terminal domain-containing protein [Pseudogracilibacillus sp.]
MDINWSLIAPLIIIQLILMVVALFDLRKQEETNGPKIVWLLVIILVNTIGPIIYFIFGRKDV